MSFSSMRRLRQNEEIALEKLKRSREAISKIRPILQRGKWEDDTSKSFATYLCQDVEGGIEAGISTLTTSKNPTRPEKVVGKKVKLSDYQSERMKKPISRRIITSTPQADGYRWKKYGNKMIKTAEYPRNYYKCAYDGCPAIKQVQQNDGEHPPNFLVIYYDTHTCNNANFLHMSTPCSSKGAAHASSPSSPASLHQNAGLAGEQDQQHVVDSCSKISRLHSDSYGLSAGDVTMTPESDNWGSVSSTCPSPEYPWEWHWSF